VRKALGTLPWVEQATIETDIPKREVRFKLKDKSAFSADQARAALQDQGFPKVDVKAGPP
jgi:hypothetical protein